jgi:hypothetical protein
MEARQNALKELLARSPRPAEGTALQAAVQTMLDGTLEPSSAELWKNTWEYVLRKDILEFTVRSHFFR